LANRRVTLAWAPGGPQTVDDTVLNWAGVDACAPPG